METRIGRADPCESSHDSFCLPRRRRYSFASSSAICNKCASSSRRWLRANRTRSAAVSAMNAEASSGPPSPRGSSSPVRRPLPEDARFRPPFTLLNSYPYPCRERRYPFRECNSREVFCNLLDIESVSKPAPSTSVDLTGRAAAPMFGVKRPARIPRNRPFFPCKLLE